jgi:hypothetical protein
MLSSGACAFFKALKENFPELPLCEGTIFLHFIMELLNDTLPENNIPEDPTLCSWHSKEMAAYAFFFVAGLLSDEGMDHYTAILTTPGIHLNVLRDDSDNFADTLSDCNAHLDFFIDRIQTVTSEQMENRLYILSKFMRSAKA